MILHGDVLKEMATIEDDSIDCIVTSPPYNKKGLLGKLKPTNQIWDKFEIDYDEGLFVIKDLEPGGPAADAGIKAEDLIIKINGYDIYLMEDMGKAFDDVLPGDEIEVVILRGDQSWWAC